MRTLVIQLARFGDIYQTWPTLKALKRQGSVDILVRERFREACSGLEGITVHTLPSAHLLGPLLESSDLDSTIARADEWLRGLDQVPFDRIVNLSFSPLSSYVTNRLAERGARVSGYTRHADGFFHAPDDTSAYFHAQVGIDRQSRYHLTDVFAAVAEVDLEPQDFFHPARTEVVKPTGVVIHLGASQFDKAYPVNLWSQVIAKLSGRFQITLIGSAGERELANQLASLGTINRVGETSLNDVANLIASAEILIGADSAPVQIANLTGTKVLNLSCAHVRFWETGPLVEGSRILYADAISDIDPSRVADETLAMLHGLGPQGPCVVRDKKEYRAIGVTFDDFGWRLIQGLYTPSDYPPLPEGESLTAFQRLFELAELACEQLVLLSDNRADANITHVLETIDLAIEALPRMNPRLQPIVSWFQTERLRIPPGDVIAIFNRTAELFEQLLWIAAVYYRPAMDTDLRKQASEISLRCAHLFREGAVAEAETEFQKWLDVVHALARHSTNVGASTWSSVLNRVHAGLERGDHIEIADILEYELSSSL